MSEGVSSTCTLLTLAASRFSGEIFPFGPGRSCLAAPGIGETSVCFYDVKR